MNMMVRRGLRNGSLLLLAALVLLACASHSGTENTQRYATLITSYVPLYGTSQPIEISRIDDRRLNLGQFDMQSMQYPNSRATHRVIPGQHTIHGIPIVRRPDKGPRLAGLDRTPQPLTANFESGRRYYLAVKPSEADRRRWQVVIWKVEDNNGGLLKL